MSHIPPIWAEKILKEELNRPNIWSEFLPERPPGWKPPKPSYRTRFRIFRRNLREHTALRIAPWLRPDDWYDD